MPLTHGITTEGRTLPLLVGADGTLLSGGGFQSSDNTTTTPLGSGETFTGEWELNDAPGVMVSCHTDNSGTLYFDFSPDGSNVNTFPTSGFSVAAGIHEFHVAEKGPRYFRVRLVNDSGAQSYLRLYTYLGTYRAPSAPANQSLRLDADALSVRPTAFQDEVRIGRRPGVTGWTKFGYRDGLTAASGEQTIWDSAGNFTPLTSASTFTVTYNSSTDGEGTTGATALTFFYIDSSGLPATATHTLGNDGSDVTSFSGLGINRIAVSATGTADKNTNDITVTATTGSTVQAVVSALGSVTQQAIFFVGSNHQAIAKYLWWNLAKPGGGNALVLIKGYVYSRAVDTFYEVFRVEVDTTVELTGHINEPIGFNLNATDVLFFVADTDTNGANVKLRFSLNEYQST